MGNVIFRKGCKKVHDIPLGANASDGQLAEFPVQYSGVSQLLSFDALQTWVVGAKLHCEVQQVLLWGSQEAPARSLQVVELQHEDVTPEPGSHSSPSSTIPFPHICSEMVCRELLGSDKHEVFVFPPALPDINEPKTIVRKSPKGDEKMRLTNIAKSALREPLLARLGDGAHNELGIGIACV